MNVPVTLNKTTETNDEELDITMDEAVGGDADAVFVNESCAVDIKANVIGKTVENSAKCESDIANREASSDVNNTKGSESDQQKAMPIRKKHRRGSRRNRRRKYKPYAELTWEEKQAVDERDTRRAVSIRKKYMHDKGRPLAPFNTSQFLMAEHDTKEPDLHVSHHHHHEPYMLLSSSPDDSDYGESSLSEEEQDIEVARNFFKKDFTETYDRLHSESLHKMNKDELVNEYMQLEDKVENLERELKLIQSNGVRANINGAHGAMSDRLRKEDLGGVLQQQDCFNTQEDKTRKKLELEMEKLREENRQLRLENSILQPKENKNE